MFYHRIATPYGKLEARWSSAGLASCAFVNEFSEDSRASLGPGSESATEVARRLEVALAGYFKGETLEWDLEALDWSGVPAFHQLVLRACARIPAGSTATYGALARQVGSPGAARAVGSAMARNRWPIVIPCHRVVGSTGNLTGYSGAGGLETKRQLLALEEHHHLTTFAQP